MGCCFSKHAAASVKPASSSSKELANAASPLQVRGSPANDLVATIAAPCTVTLDEVKQPAGLPKLDKPSSSPSITPSHQQQHAVHNVSISQSSEERQLETLPSAEEVVSLPLVSPFTDNRMKLHVSAHRAVKNSPQKPPSPGKGLQRTPASASTGAKRNGINRCDEEDDQAEVVVEEEDVHDDADLEDVECEATGRGRFPTSARKEWLSKSKLAASSTSRTNSFSRDPSPVDLARSKARISSPLRRSPSAPDPPRLARSSSGKSSSPCRSYVAEDSTVPIPIAKLNNRPHLHKHSTSKESFLDAPPHKRSSSKESAIEFPTSSELRKPSPPKKTPTVGPSSDSYRLNKRHSVTSPSKENPPSCRVGNHDASQMISSSTSIRGRYPAQRNADAALQVLDNQINARRKEKSPLRRACNGISASQGSFRFNDRNADLSINSDTLSVFNADHKSSIGKDGAAKTRRGGSRTSLKDLTNSSTLQAKSVNAKQGLKQGTGTARKVRDEVPANVKSRDVVLLHEGMMKGIVASEQQDAKVITDLPDEFGICNDYCLEAKAETLVQQEGKSVLGAFKALEEYRMQLANRSADSCKELDDDVCYSRQASTYPRESLSQPLQPGLMEKLTGKENSQQTHVLQRSSSTKKSCEPFLFSDVLMSENDTMQFEGGLTMPASVSKACSILKAVADLNKGTSIYLRKKETQDEIGKPNLLSFQFGESDPHR